MISHLPEFTEEDLREIYYAVADKLASPVVQGNDSRARKWRKHLRAILTKITETGITY